MIFNVIEAYSTFRLLYQLILSCEVLLFSDFQLLEQSICTQATVITQIPPGKQDQYFMLSLLPL
jgi:hypothetical protein